MSSSKPLTRQRSAYWKSLNSIVPEADESFFKAALYNTVMLVFLGLCLTAITAVYYLLQAFIKPILWAALAGTVVFPLKRRVTVAVKSWLRNLKNTSTPLIVGVAWIPINITDYVAETLWQIVSSKLIFLIIAYPIMVMFGRYKLFSTLLFVIGRSWVFLDALIVVLSSYWVYPILLTYSCGYMAWLWLQGPDISNHTLAKLLSAPMWFVSGCIVAGFFGPIKVIAFLVMITLVILSAAGVIGISCRADEGSDGAEHDHSHVEAETKVTSSLEEVKPKEVVSLSSSVTSSTGESDESSKSKKHNIGDTYLATLFGACALLFIATHLWLMSLLFIPLIYMILKRIGEYFRVYDRLANKCGDLWPKIKDKFGFMFKPAIPSSIRHLMRLLFSGDQKIIDGLDRSMDVLSSVIVILIVVLLSVFLAVFVVFQLHSESLHLIDLSRNVMNRTLSGDGSDVADWAGDLTGQALGNTDFEGYLDQGYEYSRGYLSTQIRAVAKGDSTKADMLEAQVKALIDKVYELILAQVKAFKSKESISGGHHADDVAEAWQQFALSFDIKELKNDIQNMISDNLETLKSVGESVLTIVKSNFSLIFSVLFGFLGVILDFGFEILSLIISTVAFFTVLYYLLASSQDQWKPLTWFSMMAPGGGQAGGGGAAAFATAVETAISGVFVLSIRMAIFYGFYVWFIHTLFNVSVVFIPSAGAALLAAVPFLGAYWVFLPGFMELWLLRGDLVLAAVFAGCHFLPMCFVDGAFYLELKGSHPYATGLAVVGGVYWMGLEGAILGPIILCCMIVMMQMYSLMWQSGSGGGSAVSQPRRLQVVKQD